MGGLGHLALQTARAMGYHTLALTSSPGKVAQALELGAHTCILASDEAALHEAQGEGGGEGVLLQLEMLRTDVPGNICARMTTST